MGRPVPKPQKGLHGQMLSDEVGPVHSQLLLPRFLGFRASFLSVQESLSRAGV